MHKFELTFELNEKQMKLLLFIDSVFSIDCDENYTEAFNVFCELMEKGLITKHVQASHGYYNQYYQISVIGRKIAKNIINEK